MEKKSIKILILVAAIIILGVIASVIFINIQNSNTDYTIEKVTSFNYFKIYINEKYGVIDSNGNIIIEPKYGNIDIPNPSKPLFVVSTVYNANSDDNETQVINEKNEKILTQYEKVLPIQLKDANTKVPYEKSVLMYKDKDKYGIIDYNGKKITDAIYDSIESLLYKEGCLLVKNNGKYGVINILGKSMVNIEYDSISADGYYDEETEYKKAGFIVGVRKEEGYRYGYISSNAEKILDVECNQISRLTEINENDVYLYVTKNGQVGVYKNKDQVIKNSYEQVEYDKNNDVYIVKKDDKYGMVNNKNESILPIEFDYIMISGNKINAEKDGKTTNYDVTGKELNLKNITIISTENSNYYITINEKGKFGVIDSNNTNIIENKYQYMEYIFDNYFIAKEDGKTGIIDVKDKTKVEFKYDVIQKIKNTKVVQAIISSENTSDIYNSELKLQLSYEDIFVVDEGKYLKVLSDNSRNYIDRNGNMVDNKSLFENAKLLAYKENGKWGFKDRSGIVKVDAKYDMVTEFNDYGFAGVYNAGKWGVIDENGSIVIAPTYEVEYDEPEFIGKYIRINFGYGFYYYTDKV